MSRRRQIATLATTACLACGALGATVAQAAFRFQSTGFAAVNENGSPDSLAGSHPWELTTTFQVNGKLNAAGKEVPDGDPKDVLAEPPLGLVGNPTVVPKCSIKDFTTPLKTKGSLPPGTSFYWSGATCPDDTQVGVADINLGGHTFLGLYNLTPPAGVPAEFGFNFLGEPILLKAALRSDGSYGLVVRSTNINQTLNVFGAAITFWGVPSDPAHDALRGECLGSEGESVASEVPEGCHTDLQPKPFLSLPTSCPEEPLGIGLKADSWQNPGTWIEETAYNRDEEGNPVGLEGCEALEFAPTIEARPETNVADSPAGLNVDLHIPQNEEPKGRATSHLRNAVVKLPAGLNVNPASADGLGACSSAQIDLHNTAVGANCPDAAKLGTVEVDTPLLEAPLQGAVYLAKPFDNPFNSLLAIYITVDDPITGVIVKLAGHVVPDPQTGQLTTTFKENPQQPVEDFKLHFFGGARAALRTPPTCGRYETTTDLTPWSGGPDATPPDSFEVSSAPGGGTCPTTAAGEPDKPSFSAGTLDPTAGAFSPFVFKLSRPDGSQELKGIDTTLPPGLVGKLAGVSYCPEEALALAATRTGEWESAHPDCPQASEVGTVNVGAGAGPNPFYVGGHAYLTGPYKSAPLSLAIITPAVAGPFDLGTVVVRTALYVNPETAQIHAVSDPIPTILDGIPLDLRSIALRMDRPDFTLNPTSCDPMAVTGSALSVLGQSSPLSSPFQVGGCSALAFKPKFALSLKGATKRTGHPALKAVLTYPKKGAYANIAAAQVTLPHSAFLDQAHIGTVCTRVQFAAHACPPASVYGHATAYTPLLEQPLSGPVYLRSSSNKLPDLVADLNGQIEVTLDGKVDTGRGGGIRNTFQVVPDAPVSKFVLSMQGGNKGLLVNSENICSHTQKALAHFVAQNGKVDNFNPVIANSCKSAKKHHKRRSAR